MYFAPAVPFVHEPNRFAIRPRLAGTTFIGRGTAPVRGVACKHMNWHDYFTYDAATGNLIWKKRLREHFQTDASWRSANTRCAGKVAGYYYPHRPRDYARVVHRGRLYLLHRVIWEMHNGPIPEGMVVDHIDGDLGNNLLSNLRCCSRDDNMLNTKKSVRNTSGFKGVHKKQNGKYIAYINKGGKRTHLGTFSDAKEAYAAYCDAATKHHGAFARTT